MGITAVGRASVYQWILLVLIKGGMYTLLAAHTTCIPCIYLPYRDVDATSHRLPEAEKCIEC